MDLANIKRPLVVTFSRQWRGYRPGQTAEMRSDAEVETVLCWIEAGICTTAEQVPDELLPKGKLAKVKQQMTEREQMAIAKAKQQEADAVKAATGPPVAVPPEIKPEEPVMETPVVETPAPAPKRKAKAKKAT